jgi:alpha-glucosidase
MSAASIAETAAAHPSLRPFGISRACSPGCQRYVTTWSGDNTTSWASLAWGLRCGLQMAVSGLYLTGQDVGGFAGPPPDPELLVRWYQAGALWPRFVSNSWKACGTATSPWLHPGAPAEACRAALQLRYRLMPYLYTLCRAASDERNEPPVRPLFWDWGAVDESVWSENSELMLGRHLLAAPVLAPGKRTRTLRLPLGPLAWFDAHGGKVLAPGSTVTVQAPLERMPLFCSAGAMLPLATDEAHQGLPHDAPGRRLLVFPAPAAAGEHVFESELFEDDGECADGGPSATLRFRLSCGAEALRLSVELEDGGYALPFKQVLVMLPPGEARQLSLTSGPGAPQLLQADWQPLF